MEKLFLNVKTRTANDHDDHSKLHGVMESIHPKQEKQNEYAYIVEIVFS